MKPIVILKMGGTIPTLARLHGDFDDWIRQGLGVAPERTRVVNLSGGDPLPDYDEPAGVLLTGSHAMVTQRRPWSVRTAEWLPGLIEREVPLLAICYGHQLLAEALGGRVGDNPNGREFGTVPLTLAAEAADDPLLGGLSNPVRMHVCHHQSVLDLPPGARPLAATAKEPHQAFRVGRCAWGVQFHPEFDREAIVAYIQAQRELLETEGQDPDRLIAETVETPQGTALLRRFGELAG